MPWWVPPRCRVSVGRILGGVGLLRRLRAVESADFHAFPENAHDRRHPFGADVEELRAEDLRGKADVGEGRGVAVAESARLLLLSQVRFEHPERLQGPVREPLVASRLVLMHFPLEVAADPRNDQRMTVAD